jgi:hypothetical protein
LFLLSNVEKTFPQTEHFFSMTPIDRPHHYNDDSTNIRFS